MYRVSIFPVSVAELAEWVADESRCCPVRPMCCRMFRCACMCSEGGRHAHQPAAQRHRCTERSFADAWLAQPPFLEEHLAHVPRLPGLAHANAGGGLGVELAEREAGLMLSRFEHAEPFAVEDACIRPLVDR